MSLGDEVLKNLYDVREAALAIQSFVSGKSLNDYLDDELLRSAVERKFEIIGEALNRIKKEKPNLLTPIRHHRSIISFRNLLIHGYDTVDHLIVWGLLEEDLGNLLTDVGKLMNSEALD